jgi:hypothetical protein
LPLIPIAEELARQGTAVFQWPADSHGKKGEKVVIYRVGPVDKSHATRSVASDRKAG